jgi:predicted ATP-grasp superfamily ATP-dependent carboligase
MSAAKSTRASVLVTDAGRGSAIAIIRSLGRMGCRVIAGDSDPGSLGFRSRYVQERLLYPPAGSDPDGLVETLLSSVRNLGVDLIIPVTDQVIHPLAYARKRFEGICKLAIADDEALEVVTEKSRTFELARRLGVPVPETQIVRSVEEARNVAARLSWPLVLKPAVSCRYLPENGRMESRSVSYASDMKELPARMEAFGDGCAILLQEYFQGTGVGVEMLAHGGQPVAAFQHKRLAEVPVTGGASAWRESTPIDPQLYDYSTRIVRELKWTGLIMIEFKVAERAQLMEINGRVWGSLPLAVSSGVDFPRRLTELYLDDRPSARVEPVLDYEVGVRTFNLDLIVLWLPQVLLGLRRYPFLVLPKRSRALAALMGLLDPRQKSDVFSLDDPRPGLMELLKIAGKVFAKLVDSLRTDGRR